MLEYIENNFAVGFAIFLVNLLVWFLFANWRLERREESKLLNCLRSKPGVKHHER
jgi:uncharacterized membrane protein